MMVRGAESPVSSSGSGESLAGLAEREDLASELAGLARLPHASPDSPLGAALLWRAFLLDEPEQAKQRKALGLLTVGPVRLDDYREARHVLPRLVLSESAVAKDEDVAFVRFHGEVDDAKRTLEVWFLTLVHGADGWWRVWSLAQTRRLGPHDTGPESPTGSLGSDRSSA